jgi:hypothetical protein
VVKSKKCVPPDFSLSFYPAFLKDSFKGIDSSSVIFDFSTVAVGQVKRALGSSDGKIIRGDFSSSISNSALI